MAASKIEGWDQDTIPGVYKHDDVVAVALRELPNGPTFIHPADEEEEAGLGAARRVDLIERCGPFSTWILSISYWGTALPHAGCGTSA
jgi:hypothetical protein